MDARLQRLIADTSKCDRIRYREGLKLAREQQLKRIKTTPLPYVMPSMHREMDTKCKNCDIDKQTFVRHDDWYLEPSDALLMNLRSKEASMRRKIVAFVLRKILSQSMNSLVIHPAHIQMMKCLQMKKKVPMVFAVKSEDFHFDLLMILFILLVNDIKLPLVGVDKKLRDVPIIGRILLELGVTFADENERISEAKLSAHLKAGGNVLVMLDGGDEEDLKQLLSACEFGLATQVFLLPVSINYEKIRRGESFVSTDNMGIVKINFHSPYTVEDLLQPNFVVEHMQAEGLMSIAKHLSFDIDWKRPVMSTNVVAFLLLTRFRDGASVDDLAAQLDDLRVKHRSLDFGFEGQARDIVEHAVEMLGKDLVEVQDGSIKPTSDVENIKQLSDYAEMLKPHFALRSALVICAQSLKRTERYVDFNALISLAVDLCQMIQCKARPCEDLELQLKNAFDQCELQEIMSKPVAEILTESEQRAQRMSMKLDLDNDDDFSDDDEGYQSRNPKNEVTLNEEMKTEIEALRCVAMPTLEIYLTVACILMKLVGMGKITRETFVEKSLKAMREECEDGNCKFWESCSSIWIDNSIKRFQSWNIINVDEHSISLHPQHDSREKMKLLIKRLERFFDLA